MDPITTKEINNARMNSDRRQFGGMLMLLGFCAILAPLAGIVSGFGPDGAIHTDAGDIPFWGLIGGFCLFINGMVALTIGYLAAVHDWSHSYLTAFSIGIIQTAFIPYITDMTNVGKAARLPANENVFIPLAYEPSDDDVKFVGAVGILAILTYGFAFVGAMSFMVFCLHSYNTGKFTERSGKYFRGRLSFYSGIMGMAGLVQLALGAFCRVEYGRSTLNDGPITAALLIVSYPTASIVVGLIQSLNGVWGIARSVGVHLGPGDIIYPISLAIQFVLVMTLQIVAQIAHLPGGTMAAAAPMVAAMSVGLNLMPAFLDHKMRTLPAEFPADYYACAGSIECSDTMSKNSDIVIPEASQLQLTEENAMIMGEIDV